MGTRKFTGELGLSYWSRIMHERIESGLSVKTYCANTGIHKNTYYYWQKKLREATELQVIDPSPTRFVEVRSPGQLAKHLVAGDKTQSEILIEIAGICIRADSTYPADKIAALLRGIM